MKAPTPKTSPQLQPVSEVAVAGNDEVTFSLLEEVVEDSEEAEAAEKAEPGSTSATPAQTPLLGASSPGKSSTFKSDEPAYVMPATPSPFLSAQFAPDPPPLWGAGYADLGLPPAFTQEGTAPPNDYYMQGMFDGSYMAMGYDPNAYDANTAAYWQGMAEAQNWDMSQTYGTMGYNPDDFDQSNMTEEGVMAAWANAAQTGDPATANGTGTEAVQKPAEESEKTRSPKLKEKSEKDKDEPVLLHDDDRGSAPSKKTKTPSPPPPEPKESLDAPSNYTTVMLRNIPNKYTREMLVEQLNRDFNGRYDFMYLPIDFKNKCNVGYSFINFRTPDACSEFVAKFNNVDVRKCLPGLNSKKIVEVTPARVQGFTENVRRLRNSPVMSQLADHPEWMPLLFNDRGHEEPFPRPESAPPPVKPRGRGRLSRT